MEMEMRVGGGLGRTNSTNTSGANKWQGSGVEGGEWKRKGTEIETEITVKEGGGC